ncbi:hypothetical protein NL676_001828 [Syzygium grande]|nr:hypothetical protein NL676_001828 [Syzygium grande]
MDAQNDVNRGEFTWKISYFSEQDANKLYSEAFTVSGCKWRILVFPKGNNTDHLSLYLDVPDCATLPNGWTRKAKFSLSVIDQINNGRSIRKGTQHVGEEEGMDSMKSFKGYGKVDEAEAGPSEAHFHCRLLLLARSLALLLARRHALVSLRLNPFFCDSRKPTAVAPHDSLPVARPPPSRPSADISPRQDRPPLPPRPLPQTTTPRPP